MKSNSDFLLRVRSWCCHLACGVLAVAGLQADIIRTQSLSLQAGWNAVFLEVNPTNSEPAAVFAGTPVDLVASYYPRSSPAQFVTDPGTDLFRQEGWGVWYAEDRPDAFLKTLHAIQGQQAYLVHAKTAFNWSVSGAVTAPETLWAPNGFNLVGFGLHPQAAPTFAQFFTGSPAHQHNRFYRLVNGSWQRISDPAGTPMRAGEAFWVWCEGPSRYQGPVAAETPTRRGLVLSSGTAAVTLRNATPHPVTASVEHLASGANPVPLSIVIQAVGDSNAPVRTVSAVKPAGDWTQALPPLEAGAALRVPLEARLEDMPSPVHGSLLKISTDLGTVIWLPVIAVREDVESR